MLKIYDIPTAQRTILQRKPLAALDYPDAILDGTARLFGAGVTPHQAVAQIMASVQAEGDAAIRRWNARLDRVQVDELRLPPEKLQAAWEGLEPGLKAALEQAAQRIRAFHAMQPLPDWQAQTPEGTLGQRVTPIERVGVYVPGGSAPLPSSLLMSVIPAQVAGVPQISVCTPPDAAPSILAAAYLCGIEQVYQVGGAQAIAALAFGSQTIPRVDKIVGAGGLWVTLAKQQVFGLVGLDGLAGPTETLVIADSSANPAWVAADLLAQAEHDILASAILLTPHEAFARQVQAQAARQMEEHARAQIIAQSLVQRGGIIITPDLESAARLASEYAPEHLCLSVAQPEALAPLVRNAGGLFLGETSCEVLGDYIAGPSHVMPTGGTARFASPLNVLDFVKISSLIALDPSSTAALYPLAQRIARAEGLTAHAAAAAIRSNGQDMPAS